MTTISIVIPAWNEGQRLGPTLAALDGDLERHSVERERAPFDSALRAPLRLSGARVDEVLIVDDGSTDDTVAVARAFANRLPIRVLSLGENQGKGHAVRAGMLAATGSIRVMCDADGAMPWRELPRLVAAVREGADVAIGSRYVDGSAAHGQPLWRRAWSRLAHRWSATRWVRGVNDIHSGYKAFTAASANALFSRSSLGGWAFDLEVLGLAQRAGLKIVEVGIAWRDDSGSRVRPLHDLGRVLGEAMALDAKLSYR